MVWQVTNKDFKSFFTSSQLEKRNNYLDGTTLLHDFCNPDFFQSSFCSHRGEMDNLYVVAVDSHIFHGFQAHNLQVDFHGDRDPESDLAIFNSDKLLRHWKKYIFKNNETNYTFQEKLIEALVSDLQEGNSKFSCARNF